MATMLKGTQTITVPDDTAADYTAQGWRVAGAPVEPIKKRAARKSAKSKQPKEARSGVRKRADSVSGSTPAGGGSVQSRGDAAGDVV